MQNAQEARSYNKFSCWAVQTVKLEVSAIVVAQEDVVHLADVVAAWPPNDLAA